jgi:hypothetical protein
VTDALPLVLILAFGALAWWFWRRRSPSAGGIRLMAAIAGAVLLVDAITEPSRRYAGLLFVFLSMVVAWRARDLSRRLEASPP